MLRGPNPIYNVRQKSWQIGKTKLTAVTAAVARFCVPFDQDYWANRKAEERGVEKAVILQEWAEKAEASRKRGKDLHTGIQEFLQGKSVRNLTPYVRNAVRACQELDIKPVAVEQRVGSEVSRLTGVIDFVGMVRGRRAILEWKSAAIETRNRFNKKMLAPLDHLQDCNWSHYSLQVGLYLQILREAYSLDNLDGYIVEVSESGYQLRQVDCIEDDARRIVQDLADSGLKC